MAPKRFARTGYRQSGLGSFVNGYVTTALWSSVDDEGEPLDQNYSPGDIAPETQRRMALDAGSFYRSHRNDFDDPSQAGHDFWLTRNGHGAGFWDGDYPEPQATRLTNASKKYGEFDLYVGDDGQIHGSLYRRTRPSRARRDLRQPRRRL